MALGNTFSATSFCSYGAYWITFGVISDLEGTKIVAAPETVCQKEILMGLFLLVSLIDPCNPYLPVASPPLTLAHQSPGLVHIHHDDAPLHAQVQPGHVPLILLPRHELPPTRHCEHAMRSRPRRYLYPEDWRVLWLAISICGVV